MAYRSEAFGYRVLHREEFFAIDKLEGLTGATSLSVEEAAQLDRQAAVKLKERAKQFDGAFVIYDPASDEDGFMLVGNDPDELDHQCYQQEIELRA